MAAKKKSTQSTKSTKSKAKKPAPKAEVSIRADSKKAKLIARLQKGPATVEQLEKASGFDHQNVTVALSILRCNGLDVQKSEDGKFSLAA